MSNPPPLPAARTGSIVANEMLENGKIRQGFTLVEMLIATGIFLIGFVSVYSLFLTGVQFRRRSENTSRGAVAASSILATIRYYSSLDNTLHNPALFEGDGDPATPDVPDMFHAYPDQPGMFFRVTNCDELFDHSSAIKLSVQTVFLGAPQDVLTAPEVARRLGHPGKDLRPDLLDRGLIREQVAIIYRR